MGLGSLGFYYALLIAMVLWMAIRINRVSTGMAVATFVCWPLAIIPLITNWGSRGSDIRLPFLVAALAGGMIMYSTNQVVQNTALMYSPSDIEAIRSEDPQFAAEIEREQLRALGVEVEFEAADPGPASSAASTFATISVEPGSGGRRAPIAAAAAPASPAAAPAAAEELQFAPAPAQIRKVPLRELRFRRGQIRLSQAFARLDVPQHFRFVSAQQLGTLAEMRGIPVSDATIGWLVHERVNLGSSTFWFVDVQFHESGHLSAPAADATPTAGRASILAWDGDRAMAIWSSPWGQQAAGKELAAAKLMRHGAVVYRLPDLAPDQAELGLRAARLLALRTLPEPGWAYDEFTGAQSAQSLSAWLGEMTTPATTTMAPVEQMSSAVERRS